MPELPPAPVAQGTPVWDYEIALEPTERNLLVALEMPLALPDGMEILRREFGWKA